MSASSASVIVTVGDSICGGRHGAKLLMSADDLYLRGYNTYQGSNPVDVAAAQIGGGEIIAAINGVVEITDHVVSVKGFSSRYEPEVGDIVVGRVTCVAGNRWRVDVGATQDAIMLLANVTEPGGILRRRGRDDELTMRQLFDEDEVIVAEVQRISPDGVISLHTRQSEKYGKLQTVGTLTSVPPALVRRARHQFNTLGRYGVSIIVGMNGRVWVCESTKEQLREAASLHETGTVGTAGDAVEGSSGDDVSQGTERATGGLRDDVEVHRAIARVSACVAVMGRECIPVHHTSIAAAVRATLEMGIAPFDVQNLKYRDVVVNATSHLHDPRKKRPRE